MLFRTHFVFGIFLYLVILLFAEVNSPWFFLVGILLGSLFVDLDTPKSKVGGYFIFRPLQLLVKHRGFFHSLLFGFIIMVLLSIFQVWLAFGFILGFLGHLFLDSFTKRKVVLFWPLYKTKFGFGLVKSGGLIEMIVFVFLLTLDGFLFYLLVF